MISHLLATPADPGHQLSASKGAGLPRMPGRVQISGDPDGQEE